MGRWCLRYNCNRMQEVIMINFYIYNNTTGQIYQTGYCGDDELAMQECPSGYSIAIGSANIKKHYHDITNNILEEFGDKPSNYHNWDWAIRAWVLDIVAVRTALKEKINEKRDLLIQSPLLFNGSLYDADERAITNLTIWKGEILPDGFVWRDADNEGHIVTTGFIESLLYAIAVRGTELYKMSWQKKAEIDALDPDDLLNYNVDSGWN